MRDQLEPLRVGNGRWVTASSSTPGLGYTQIMREDGLILCSCPGGQAECKHKAAIRMLLEAERDGLVGVEPPTFGQIAAADMTRREPTTREPVTIAEEFWIERQGRKFPRYAGVLNAATRSGLVSLVSTLVQLGTDENEQTWIATATAKFVDGRVFTDVGVATPANVTRQMLPFLTLMASTRAKGRALRDAIDVGVATAEELGDQVGDDLGSIRAEAAIGRAEVRRMVAAEAVPARPVTTSDGEQVFPGQRPEAPLMPRPAELDYPRLGIEPLAPPPGVTEPQIRNIRRLWRGLKLDGEGLDQACAERWEGAVLESLTRKQASDWIGELMRGIARG